MAGPVGVGWSGCRLPIHAPSGSTPDTSTQSITPLFLNRPFRFFLSGHRLRRLGLEPDSKEFTTLPLTSLRCATVGIPGKN